MSFVRHIPNGLTSINLIAGFTAIYFIFNGYPEGLICCMIASLLADLLDGWAARKLNVAGPLGVQLDSLADMVSFGVVPGLMSLSLLSQDSLTFSTIAGLTCGALITTSAFWRLAKFNLDTRQSSGFLGLPTPAMSMYILGLYIVKNFSSNDQWSLLWTEGTLLIQTSILAGLMLSEIPVPSLKDLQNHKNFVIILAFLIITAALFTYNIAPELLLWQSVLIYICTTVIYFLVKKFE